MKEAIQNNPKNTEKTQGSELYNTPEHSKLEVAPLSEAEVLDIWNTMLSDLNIEASDELMPKYLEFLQKQLSSFAPVLSKGINTHNKIFKEELNHEKTREQFLFNFKKSIYRIIEDNQEYIFGDKNKSNIIPNTTNRLGHEISRLERNLNIMATLENIDLIHGGSNFNQLRIKSEQVLNFESDTTYDQLLLQRYDDVQKCIHALDYFIKNKFPNAIEILEKRSELEKEIINRSLELAALPTRNDKEIITAYKKYRNGGYELLVLTELFKILPREEIAKIDLKTALGIGHFKDMSGDAVLENPDLFEEFKAIIRKEFPGASADQFEEEIINNSNLRITASYKDFDVLCLYGKEKKAENIYYMDWFISNQDAALKGLGEATVQLAFDEPNEKASTHYAVAKPHVKSYELIIENFGFVGSGGSTLDNEYHDHYARVRRLPTDETFVSKNIPDSKKTEFENILKQLCFYESSPSQEIVGSKKFHSRTHQFIYSGKILKTCKVEFAKTLNHHVDIDPASEDGWFYKELENQTKAGFVLTRYIKSNDSKDKNTFYAVFEKDNADTLLKNNLQEVIDTDIAHKLNPSLGNHAINQS